MESLLKKIVMILTTLDLDCDEATYFDCNDLNPDIGNQFGDKNCDGVLDDMISAGSYHTCGIKMDGSVECWGSIQVGKGLRGMVPLFKYLLVLLTLVELKQMVLLSLGK